MYEKVKFINGGKFISRKDTPWIHTARTIDTAELIIVTDGEVNMFVGDKEYSVGRGGVLRILPEERHGGTRESLDTSFFWLHFLGAEESELPDICSYPEGIDRALPITRELLHYAETDGYPEECADSMMKILLAELTHTPARSEGSLVTDIKEWLKREGVCATVADVAAHYGYNADYLNRAFKKRADVGLKRYIDELRIERIKRDLVSGVETLGELSDKYGFSEYKYFLKFFKYHAGTSPTKYRDAYCNLHTN